MTKRYQLYNAARIARARLFAVAVAPIHPVDRTVVANAIYAFEKAARRAERERVAWSAARRRP